MGATLLLLKNYFMITLENACNALIDGKLVVAYFGNNGDYKFNHVAAPVEIRLLGNLFCTYTSKGIHSRRLKGRNILKALQERFELLDIHPVCILDARPVREPLIR